MSGRTRAEQETVIRWDQDTKAATLWTAAPVVARKWTRLGYPIEQHGAGWRVDVPIRALTFRRMGQKPREGPKQAVPLQFLRAKAAGRVGGP